MGEQFDKLLALLAAGVQGGGWTVDPQDHGRLLKDGLAISAQLTNGYPQRLALTASLVGELGEFLDRRRDLRYTGYPVHITLDHWRPLKDLIREIERRLLTDVLAEVASWARTCLADDRKQAEQDLLWRQNLSAWSGDWLIADLEHSRERHLRFQGGGGRFAYEEPLGVDVEVRLNRDQDLSAVDFDIQIRDVALAEALIRWLGAQAGAQPVVSPETEATGLTVLCAACGQPLEGEQVSAYCGAVLHPACLGDHLAVCQAIECLAQLENNG